MATRQQPAIPAPSITQLIRLALLGALIGLPVGLVAFAFIAVIHGLETWLWHDLPRYLGSTTPPWYLVVGLPVLGGVLVYLARLLPGGGGEPPLDPHDPAVVMRPVDGLGVVAAAVATLPFGMVLGPEAPLLALGMIVGQWLTSWVRLSGFDKTLIGLAGSGAALSTLFGGPLVSGLMVLELVAGTGVPIVAVMVPALTASAVAYTLITGLGGWSGLPMAGMAVPDLPTYSTVVVVDLLVAVVVAVLTAVAAALIRRLAGVVAHQEARIGRLPLLAGGGLAVGLLALLAGGLGANPEDVLFSGQTSMGALTATTAVGTVVVLLVAKALAYTVSLGAGFRGGPIFPAIFVGVAIAQLSVIWLGMSPTVAVAIGAAAGMAAMNRMLIASVLFAFMLTSTAGLDAVVVATIAAVTARLAADWLELRFARPLEPAVSRPA